MTPRPALVKRTRVIPVLAVVLVAAATAIAAQQPRADRSKPPALGPELVPGATGRGAIREAFPEVSRTPPPRTRRRLPVRSCLCRRMRVTSRPELRLLSTA